MANTPTVEKWIHSGIRTIDLPSGGEADVEPAEMTELIYGDPEEGIEPTVPNEFLAIAEKTEYEGVDAEKMEASERVTFNRYRNWLIADRLRRYRHADGSELTKITPNEARKLPYDDRIAIFRIALHMDLAERLMLASFRGVKAGNAGNGSGPAAGSPAK